MTTFDIYVNGVGPDALDDHEKENLAIEIHDLLIENFNVFPESVGVEGYMEDR